MKFDTQTTVYIAQCRCKLKAQKVVSS